MAALDDLQTALLAKAALITDAVQKAECEAAVAEYIAIRRAIAALSSLTVTSYSLTGRSVTRADIGTLRNEAAASRSEIETCFTGDRVLIADLSGEWGTW